MTTKADLARLFDFAPETTRIAALCQNVGVSDFADGYDYVAVIGRLADPKTKGLTDNSLMVTLPAVDAVSMAISILHVAKLKGWPIPMVIAEVSTAPEVPN